MLFLSERLKWPRYLVGRLIVCGAVILAWE
jgi:hypothetical protein